MAIEKINEGITGEQAANIIYENDMQALTKAEAGFTVLAEAGTEWATELINSDQSDPDIWYQDRIYSSLTGNLSAVGSQPDYIASVKKYEIPEGNYEFTSITQIIAGNTGLCLYDKNSVFIKSVTSLRSPVDFNTEGAKYFTVTHRKTLPVSGISLKNNTVIYNTDESIFAFKDEVVALDDFEAFEQGVAQEFSDINNEMVKADDLGIVKIPSGTEWLTELINSDPLDADIWHFDRVYRSQDGELSAEGIPTFEGFNASVKKYEIPEGNYEFTTIMQVVLGSVGLCLYDANDVFIKTISSLMVPVVFNTEGAKYCTVTYRATRPVNLLSLKNNTAINSMGEDPLFIPTEKENEFLKRGDIPEGLLFNRFSEVEEGDSFPPSCEVGLFDLVRNTDTKTGDVYQDYDVKGQNFPPIGKARILNTTELTRAVCDVSENGDMFTVVGKNVYISTDLGATWTTLVNLPEVNALNWVFCLDNGELLLLDSTIKGATPAEDSIGGVYVSSENRTVFTKTWTYRNRYQYIVPSWGVELLRNGVIYFSEYGNSYPGSQTEGDPTWDKGTKADATRIWKSEDYGQTFTQFVDLNTLTDLYPANGNLHIHGIHYDKHWDRLWVTSGDGGGAVKSNKKLAWTDDGVAWGGIDLSNYFSGGGSGGTPYENLQGLSMYSTSEVLLIGADCWNNAVFRVSKRKRDNVYLEESYNPSPHITNDITYFTGRFTQYVDSPIFIPFGRGDAQTTEGRASRHPKIVATWNGLNFTEIWLDEENPQGCNQQYFRVWKIRGKYYIHIQYPTVRQFLIEFEF